jgi:hypothetical protein
MPPFAKTGALLASAYTDGIDDKTVIKTTLTTVTEALWRRIGGITQAWQARHVGAAIPGKNSGLSPVILLACALLLAWNTDARAVVKVSNGSGNWGAAGTWTPGGAPTAADDVTIAAGHTVTMNDNPGAARSLTIDGTANWIQARTTNVGVGGIIINAGGDIAGAVNGVLTSTGGLTINAVTTSATVTVILQTTAGQTISGTGSLAGLTVNATATNTGTLTVTTVLAGSSTLTNTGTLNIGGTSTVTGLTANAAGNTVNYSGAVQTVRNPTGATYHHLILSGSGAKTMPAAALAINGNFTMSGTASATAGGAMTVGGNFTLGGGTTFGASTFSHAIAGNFTNNGATFTPSTSTVTLNGGSAQIIGGTTSTTFNNLAINSAGVTLSGVDATAGAILTLTSGVLTTGANTLITTGNCTLPSVVRAAGHVAGFLRMSIPAGSPSCTFHVGDSATYRPLALVFAAGTTAGNLTGSVSQGVGDHPNVATSGIDGTLSVNRYWTLTNGGVGLSGSGYSGTFNFVAGDVDGGANPLEFEVEPWSGAAWSTTTVGTRTATSTQASGITAFGDFISGKKKPIVPPIGGFNAYETSTAAGVITGVIKTRIAGAAASLDMIALNAAKTAIATTFIGTVRVEVLDASNNSAALDANGCRPTWGVIQTLSPDPIFVIGDNGRKTISFTQANSYPDVRLRITFPAGAPTVTGCTSDNFAIRPSSFASFAVTDADWQTAGTSRALDLLTFAATTPTHKAGRPFSVRATAVNAAAATTTNYAGAPTATLSACAGAACTATFGNMTLNSTFAAGQLASDVASYDNVGSFALRLEDQSFATVDAADTTGDCTASGRYVCSATLDVGRFVPDHFAVSLNAPEFGTACGSFSYIGQAFNYTSLPLPKPPVITVTAQDFANNTTTLYITSGSWWRITNASLTGKSYTAATGTLDVTGVPGADPVIFAGGGGMGTLTFGSGTGLFFTRTTPTAPASPYDADISLEINVVDADGVTYTSNPARFGTATAGNGIAFSDGNALTTNDKQMRFGRLAMRNANGSQLVPLPVQVESQYWLGAPTNAFVTNVADSCTTIAATNDAMGNFTSNLSGSPTCETAISNGGALSAGRRTLLLAAPGSGNNGSVDLTINLGASASGTTCTTAGGAPVAATTANLPYLRGNWTGGAYDQNPSARATFGVFRGSEEVIFVRENF